MKYASNLNPNNPQALPHGEAMPDDAMRDPAGDRPTDLPLPVVTYLDIPGAHDVIKCKLFHPRRPAQGVVIGVHGFAGDKESSALKAVAMGLSADHALLCFDFPAHGKSPASDDQLTVANCKADLLTVFQYVRSVYPAVPIHVFATSFGGYVTLLSVSETDFSPETIILRAPAIRMADIFKNKIVGCDFARYRKQGYIECGFDRKMYVPFAFYEELASHDAVSVIPRIPLLIFCATEDELVDAADLHRYAQTVPSAKISDVKGATHRFKGPGELDHVVEETVRWIRGSKGI